MGLDWRQVPSKRTLHAYCDCDRFAGGTACGHLWATLLALGASGPENQPAGKDRVGLRKSRARSLGEFERSLDSAPADDERPQPRGKRASRGRKPRARRAADPLDAWRGQLDSIRKAVSSSDDLAAAARSDDPASDRLRFLVNTTESAQDGGLVLDVFTAGTGSRPAAKLQKTAVDPDVLAETLRKAMPAEAGASALPLITVLSPDPPGRGRKRSARHRPTPSRPEPVRRFRLPPRLWDALVPNLAAAGRLGWWDGRPRAERNLLKWDDGPAWQLALRLDNGARQARIVGSLVREGDRISVAEPDLIVAGTNGSPASSFLLLKNQLSRFASRGPRDLAWIRALRDMGEIVVPDEDLGEAFSTLVEIPGLPRIDGPQEYQLTEERSKPRPRLVLESEGAGVLPNAPLLAKQSFIYGTVEVGAEEPHPSVIDWEKLTFVQRDLEAEHDALLRLLEAGARPMPTGGDHALQVPQPDLPAVVEPLLSEGWEVVVRGTSLSLPDPPAMRVEKKTDWFEVSGNTDFRGNRVELKQILEAISSGKRFIELGDGSHGLLPASWIDNFDSLSKLAHDDDEGKLKFLPSQALLVDVLLSAMPPADVDGSFTRLREKLGSFKSIKPKKEPRGFSGTLRTYQREGLAWLDFLREFGLGGVLADDMGLGKTVQVLALLRANRAPSKTTGLPSLVLAPRSLVYNWIDEAARFTPSLKVVEYRGPGREALKEKFSEFDIIVTTYGTLRRDIDFLATVQFDTLILDEAQAIKNRDSLSAKACRLLRAHHRLALTGTPIENHLGELGSIFEILNPGLLGSLPKLEILGASRTASEQELKLVAEGLRPFILRRTKAEVLKDLPPKTEQILYCSLHDEQQEIYDKLRLAYQATLLGEVEGAGKQGSAIQVLEALLRLRQVACHPGLVDPDWESAGSAKLEALFEQVEEVLDEGHKVIVFSQFTKLLAYVRAALDERGVTYAYLDGQTRDRGAEVERFQTDPATNLFLISLKAGGLGLNLTAAGYVFLLDPWWNPAVEAQAIDRAHRIGQTQPVFAYRMIARGTVEEKILTLQESKRKLVEAVLGGEEQSMPSLTADDLRMLLA